MRNNNFWLNLFLILAGVVLGTMVSRLTSGMKFLSWLSFGLSFGTPSPFTLDLGIMSLTFGISIDITVSTIICIALSLLLGKLIVKR